MWCLSRTYTRGRIAFGSVPAPPAVHNGNTFVHAHEHRRAREHREAATTHDDADSIRDWPAERFTNLICNTLKTDGNSRRPPLRVESCRCVSRSRFGRENVGSNVVSPGAHPYGKHWHRKPINKTNIYRWMCEAKRLARAH